MTALPAPVPVLATIGSDEFTTALLVLGGLLVAGALIAVALLKPARVEPAEEEKLLPLQEAA